jgi:translin
MNSIEQLEELAHAHFSAKHEARERSLAHARLLIRHAGNAIRAVHRREYADAEALLEQAAGEMLAIGTDLAGLPELYYHNYITDALKEYAEARLTMAIVHDDPMPLPDALGVGYVAYFNGLAESVGELRRFVLDALRRDDLATGERLLSAMDDVYELLITIDYPDAVTGSLRRATDSVRGILERTRGDLTATAGQRRLERALSALQQQLSARGIPTIDG